MMDSPTRPPPPPVAPKPSKALRSTVQLSVNTNNSAAAASNHHYAAKSSEPLSAAVPASHHSTTSAAAQNGSTSFAKTTSEKELDDLTSQLMFGMEQASIEPEFVGVCSRCSGVIKGSQDACTAMDKFYHTLCFTCEVCSRALSGHSFYAVEDRVMCEGCYVNTLEKCNECKLPVTDRILRATGKVYHPACFICTHCNKNLDGVPFTVDAHNKIHCIEDFHLKYAPRCSVCRQAILPDNTGVETVRVVALDRNFHVQCYKCEDCAVVMSTDNPENGCFPLDGHLFCRNCNCIRIQQLSSSSGATSPTATSDL